jgi:hypothetical protein
MRDTALNQHLIHQNHKQKHKSKAQIISAFFQLRKRGNQK